MFKSINDFIFPALPRGRQERSACLADGDAEARRLGREGGSQEQKSGP